MDEPTPPLLKLPPELQIAVAELLQGGDLLSLRLVNRELAANTFDIFARHFFTDRSHVLTNHSLNALRDITAKPEIVRHMKKIEFVAIGTTLGYDEYLGMPGAYPLEPGEPQPWCREVDDAYGWQDTGVLGDIFKNLALVPGSYHLVVNSSTYSRYELLSKWPRKTHLNPLTGLPSTMWTHPHLDVESLFGLAIYQDNFDTWKDQGDLITRSPLNTAEVILKALFRSDWRPTSLAIAVPTMGVEDAEPGGDLPSEYYDTWITELCDEEGQGMGAVCGELVSLAFDIDNAGALSPTIEALLVKMKNLVRFKISSCPTHVLEAMHQSLIVTNLQCIHLDRITGASGPLHSFLSQYAGSCEDLALNKVALWDRGTRDIFQTIVRSYDRLQTLRIHQLTWDSDDDDVTLEIDIVGSQPGRIEGREEIKRALSEYCLRGEDFIYD